MRKMIDIREKLIDLVVEGNIRAFGKSESFAEIIADHLIANGVTVQTADEQRNTYTVQEIEALQLEAYDLGADSVLHNRFGLSWDDAAGLRKEIARLQVATKWIPVTERLPEPEKRVLLMTNYKGWNGKTCREVMCGFYEDGNVWCEDSKACWDYEMKREENYDESRDDYRVPEGWFEELLNHIDDYNCVSIGEPVTHWMPLPEPPKEETQ